MNRIVRSNIRILRYNSGAPPPKSKLSTVLPLAVIAGGAYGAYEYLNDTSSKQPPENIPKRRISLSEFHKEDKKAIETPIVEVNKPTEPENLSGVNAEEKNEVKEPEVDETIVDIVPPKDEVDEDKKQSFEDFFEDKNDQREESASISSEIKPEVREEEITTTSEVEDTVIENVSSEESKALDTYSVVELSNEEVPATTEDYVELTEVATEVSESVSETVELEKAEVIESGPEVAELTTAEQIGQLSRVAAQNTDTLIDTYDKSIKAINDYIRAKKYALSYIGETDRKVAIWLQVAEYEHEMEKNLNSALFVNAEASNALEKLSSYISDIGPESSLGLDQEADSMMVRIKEAESRLAASRDSLKRLNELEAEVEHSLADKKQEISNLLGDDNDEEVWKLLNPKFSNDDLKGLIFIAQKKIEQYNIELTHLRDNQDKITAEALQAQREEIMTDTQRRIEELEALQDEKIAQRKEEIKAELEAEHESDLSLQLKRQAAAHSLHLVEELSNQEEKITHTYKTKIDDEIEKLTQQYQQQIENERRSLNTEIGRQAELNTEISAKLKAYLDGIDTTIKERIKTENEVTKLQTLAVGVKKLEKVLDQPETGPLEPVINDLLKIKSESQLLVPVLNAIPEQAISRGVLSGIGLRQAFTQLKQAALERHQITADNHGLFQQNRSYLNYMLHNTVWASKELKTLESIISQAEHRMALGDFESAVRIVNQATGEPKRIFNRWLDEARLWLEVKQAIDVVVAMSEARSLSVRCLS